VAQVAVCSQINTKHINTMAVPKLMPPILLRWPTKSEANVVNMAVEVEPSRQYSVKFRCSAADGSRGAVWQNGVRHGIAYETKVCNWIPPCGNKIVPNDIHRCLLNVYREQTVDVSTVRRWVAGFSIGDGDVKDKTRSGRPCTALRIMWAERTVVEC